MHHCLFHTLQVNEQEKLLRNELVVSIPDDIPEPLSVSCAKLLFRRMCEPTDPLLLNEDRKLFVNSFKGLFMNSLQKFKVHV